MKAALYADSSMHGELSNSSRGVDEWKVNKIQNLTSCATRRGPLEPSNPANAKVLYHDGPLRIEGYPKLSRKLNETSLWAAGFKGLCCITFLSSFFS